MISKPGVSEKDCEMFNAGDMSAEDFQSGKFGSLEIGDDFEDGDQVNIMAKGTVKGGKLNISNVAVVGAGMDDSENPEESENTMADEAVNKIMKGDDDETY